MNLLPRRRAAQPRRGAQRRPPPSAKVTAVPALTELAIVVGSIGVLGYLAELMLVLAGVLFAGFAVARLEQVVTGMGERVK